VTFFRQEDFAEPRSITSSEILEKAVGIEGDTKEKNHMGACTKRKNTLVIRSVVQAEANSVPNTA